MNSHGISQSPSSALFALDFKPPFSLFRSFVGKSPRGDDFQPLLESKVVEFAVVGGD